MRKLMYFLAVLSLSYSCKTTQDLDPVTPQHVEVKIDLINVQNDRVMVSVDPGRFTSDQTIFYIPTTVPGTYSIDNYGTLIEDLKAYDYLGKELLLTQKDDNS